MKKIIVALGLFLVVNIPVFAYNCQQIDGIYYNLIVDYDEQPGKSIFYASVTFLGGVTPNYYSNYYKGSINIPSFVTYNNEKYIVRYIGDYAFYGCSELTSIIISDSIRYIGHYAFCGCSKLTSIIIPKNVSNLGEHVFDDCRGLVSVKWNAEWAVIINIDDDMSPIIFNGSPNLSSFVFGDDVLAIPDYICCGLNKISSIAIPNLVEYIGDYAFFGCSNLTSIVIPKNVTEIGNHAFIHCPNITSFVVEQDNQSYDSRGNCNAIIETKTKKLLFGCQNTKIPNTISSIADYAFVNCTGLSSVVVPNSVTSIGGSAFEGCTGVKSVIWNAKDCNSCNFGSQVEIYVLGSGVEKIPAGLCNGMDKLESIIIPNSVVSIGSNAFYNCRGLSSISIPNSVISIDDYAFAKNTFLSEVILGENVKEIGCHAFDGDFRVESITSYATITPTVCETTFDGLSKEYVYLYVPEQSIRKYQVDPSWNKFDIKTKTAISSSSNGIVSVVPSIDNATFTWPANDQAETYSLEITKDGVVCCTLKFNAQGQLVGIAFAPERNGNHHTPSAVLAANGWQFTITGLNAASRYNYKLDVTDATQKVIKSYKGEFVTDGYTDLISLPYGKKDGVTKFFRDGQLYIQRDGKTYNAQGGVVE